MSLNKKIVIINGSGGVGKNTFVDLVSKYIPTAFYDSVKTVKDMATLAGWDGSKSEKDRKFLSDIRDLTSEYSDLSYRKVKEAAQKFYKDDFCNSVLFVNMRDQADTDRAIKEFGAITLLIRNNNVKKVNSNHADADVEKRDYDCVIENGGTLQELDKLAYDFVQSLKLLKYV